MDVYKARDGVIACGGGLTMSVVFACTTGHKDAWACCMPAEENMGQKKGEQEEFENRTLWLVCT